MQRETARFARIAAVKCGRIRRQVSQDSPSSVVGSPVKYTRFCNRQNADLNAARNVLFAGVPGQGREPREVPGVAASSIEPDMSRAEAATDHGSGPGKSREILRHLRDPG